MTDNGGSVIRDTFGDWYMAIAPASLNALQWGAVGSSMTTSVSSFPASSTALAVSSVKDFLVGEYISVQGAGSPPLMLAAPTLGTVTASGTVANFTGTSSGTTLNVSNVTGSTAAVNFMGTADSGSNHEITAAYVSGVIAPDAKISGTGIPVPTYVQYQVSGTPGGAGVYLTTSVLTASGTVMVTVANPGAIRIGASVTGSCISGTVKITGGPITGGAGAYTTDVSTSCSMAALTSTDNDKTYCVELVALDSKQGFSAASSLSCTSNLYGTLSRPVVSSFPEFITIPWTAAAGTAAVAVYAGPNAGALSCRFVQDVAFANARSDYGQSSECPSWLPTMAPSGAQGDILRAQIMGISGTTLTLDSLHPNQAGITLTSGTVAHDDTTPLQMALDNQRVLPVPCGTFNIDAPLLLDAASGQSLVGGGQQCTALHFAGTFDGLTFESPGARFSGSGSGTNLTVSATSFSGRINGALNGPNSGDTVSGAGVPPGTTIVSQTSGQPGADGVYVTSNATTASGAALTSTGASSSSASFLGTITSGSLSSLTVTSVTGNINVGDFVSGNACLTTAAKISMQASGVLGSNGSYVINPAATCGFMGLPLSSTGPAVASLGNMALQGVTLDGSDLASNFCIVDNNTSRVLIQNVVLNQCYDEVEITNAYIGTVDNLFSNTRRRGDLGWWLWGAGSGGGSQAGIFDLTQVNLANAYQGISWYEDGNVATIRARHLGIQEAPVEFVSDNAIGSSQTPLYGEFYDMGLNVCWYSCMYLKYANGFQFYAAYIQGNASSFANTVQLATNAVWTQFFGGTIFNGYNVIDDNGFATQIHGVNVWAAENADIECEPGAIGEGIFGGSGYNITAPSATSISNYGVKLDAASGSLSPCTGAHVSGNWLGLLSNVYDQTPTTAGTIIEGISQGSSATLMITAAGSQTLSTSGYPGLYTATGGRVAVLDAKAAITSGRTYTTDTAANIITSLGGSTAGGIPGVQFRITVNSHSQSSIALAGGTGVTLSGSCTVPATAASGASAYLNLIGTVTSSAAVKMQCY